MRSLDRLARDEARDLTAILFDLDDTLLTHGRLTRAAFGALWDLHDAGLALFAVTGRPAGWGELVLRQWPLRGVVAENGAVILSADDGSDVRKVRAHGDLDDGTRATRAAIVRSILENVAEMHLADDNAARLSDTTFDIGEHRHVARDRVEAARAIAHAAGARTLVSSVHMHVTSSGDDKASGALRMLRDVLALDVGAARARAAFIGDSENDAACFNCFRTTVGVANVAKYVSRLSLPPRYVTTASMGAGFAEFSRILLAKRA